MRDGKGVTTNGKHLDDVWTVFDGRKGRRGRVEGESGMGAGKWSMAGLGQKTAV